MQSARRLYCLVPGDMLLSSIPLTEGKKVVYIPFSQGREVWGHYRQGWLIAKTKEAGVLGESCVFRLVVSDKFSPYASLLCYSWP